ncbi:MAG: DUF1800 domain-containing protein [Pseudomonadota bacterium]
MHPAVAAIALWLAATTVFAQPLGAEGAKRLLTRAGFAPNADEVARYAPLAQRDAVERLLAEARTAALTTPPSWIDEPIVAPRALRAMSEDGRRAERQRAIRQGLELRGWWLGEMVATPTPLTERMTLFWHNHFVSAQPKVRWAQLMYRQNVLLRAHALGNFGALLHAVAKDPAMLVYLDGATSRRGAPNENFAREVMELFTLGEGGYTERDVKEAARAFTGWSVDPDTGAFVFRPRLHDDGEKTVLGRSGRFDGDAVLDILLEQPATARFVVGKLWREFVSPRPDPARIDAIAQRFRASGYEIRVALRELLLQPEVVSAAADDALVKSPVELLVGFVRQSRAELTQPVGAALALAAMGQNLFAPPNVRGWLGGEAWINTQTLLARKQFLDRALARAAPPEAMDAIAADGAAGEAGPGAEPMRRAAALAQALAVRVDAAAWLRSVAAAAPERPIDAETARRLVAALLVAPPAAPPQPATLALDALRAVVLDPAYQLK